MERQSVEELVGKNHSVSSVCRRDGIQIIVPLNLPTILLDERLQSLFLNGPEGMARLNQVYLLYCCLGCRELRERLQKLAVS